MTKHSVRLLSTALAALLLSALAPTAFTDQDRLPAVASASAEAQDDSTATPEATDEEVPGDSEGEEEWDVSNPPGEWQTVPIDTTETTWSNVDVSPDGTTIVFDMLGDLYTVPIQGGDATPLTEGIAWDFQPRFSPDGTRIAFISDRAGGDNLWVMGADGEEPKAVTEEKEHLIHNPYWSPDSEYILARKGFTSTRSIPSGEIWLYHSSGGAGLQLIERPDGPRSQKNLAEPSFSPDGRYVYWAQDTTPGRVWQYNKDSTGSIFSILRLDRETGETETYVSGPGGAIRPTPSPDGKTLAFIKRLPGLTSAIYLKDLESGKEWAVFDHFERDLQETNGSQGNTTAIAWTPDGSSIVFWSTGKLHRVDVTSREVTEIPVHVRVDKKIHLALRFPVEVAPEVFRVRMLRWPQTTPDGGTAVFQALGHIWVENLATGDRHRLTSQDDHFEFYPSVSPDGLSVAYVTWDDLELGGVRVSTLDGRKTRTITTQPGHYLEPRFSPDGKWLVFRKFTGGYLLSPLWSMEPGIYLAPSAGGEAVRLADSGFDAHFGAALDRVYFSDSGEDTELLLKSVNLEGLDERTHLEGAEVTEFHVSPDGRWVAFTEDYNAFVTPFVATGKTVEVGSSMSAMPVKQVSKRSGEFLHWSPDSTALHWAHGATLYTRQLKDAFAFLEGAPDELPEPVEEGLDLSFDAPSDRPEGTIVLTGARIVTMRDADRGEQEVIDDGVVVVTGNRIAAIGPSETVEVPAGAFVVDASGKTIVPGFVDVHEHGPMASNEINPEQNWNQFSNLAFGVTTIHDPSNDTSEIFSAAELQRAGLMVAPRIFSTGTILYGAHVPGYTAKIENLDDARFHVRRLKDVGAISVKSYQLPRRDQRQQVIAAAGEAGIMVVPEGGAKFQHNLTEIVDGHTGIEHAVPIAHLYDDVLQLWSQTEVGYTPTLGVAYGGLSGELYWYDRTDVWKNERLMRYSPRFIVEPAAIRRPKAPDSHYNHFEVARGAKALRDRGVSVQVGAHGQREGLAAHWEMWMLEQGGFTPWEALRAATIDGARYVGLDGDIGSLEPGKLADLVVIDGNPLDNLRRSEYVAYTMINGRLYEAATMNQVGNEPVARQPFFFELEGGDTIHPATVTYFEQFAIDHGWIHSGHGWVQ